MQSTDSSLIRFPLDFISRLSQLYPEARHFSLHGSSGLLQAQFRDTFGSYSLPVPSVSLVYVSFRNERLHKDTLFDYPSLLIATLVSQIGIILVHY